MKNEWSLGKNMSERRNFMRSQDKARDQEHERTCSVRGYPPPNKVQLETWIGVVKGRPHLKCLCTHIAFRFWTERYQILLSRGET